MTRLAAQRCLLHPAREAAVRCPQCKRAYCRECVTEHDGRFLCAACLRAAPAEDAPRPARLRWMLAPLQLALGLAVAWILFGFLGLVLLRTPSEWHEGLPAMLDKAR